jgi:hypothetical protein
MFSVCFSQLLMFPCTWNVHFFSVPYSVEGENFYSNPLALKSFVKTHLTGLTFWRRNLFFLILAHPVYKM